MSAGDWLPVASGARQPNAVAITIDDGPAPETTPLILDSLRRHDATATFFLLAARAHAHPDLTRRIVAAGHPVYSHGYAHVPAETRSGESLRSDLARAERVLARLRPTPSPYIIRLPYGSGHRSAAVHRTLRRWRPDARIAHWRHEFNDAALAAGCTSLEMLRDRCAANVARMAEAGLAGAALLMHDSPIGLDMPFITMVGPTLLEILLDRLAADGVPTTGIGDGRQLPLVGRYVRIDRG
ncbi:MAG: polysaccharide deacetylase family protein [Sphingomonas sp.]